MFRLFSSSRSRNSSPSRASGSKKQRGLRVQINVPSYGCVFMNRRRPESSDYTDITHSILNDDEGQQLSGELEIEVPRGLGRRRCRAIRVFLRAASRLYMGAERGWEDDVLFERKVEVRGAIILEEGTQRFNFTMTVPFGLATQDVHPNGRLSINLFAEVEGLGGKTVSPFSPQPTPSQTPSATPRRGRSPVRGASSGASTPPEGDADAADAADPPTIMINPNMTVAWSDPVSASAVLGEADEEVRWLRGTVEVKRDIGIMYNPHPQNGVNTLDDRRQGSIPGIGPFDIYYWSKPWTICALLKTHVVLPEPTPRTTIFYLRVLLKQTSSITSPRDDPATTEPIVTTTSFVIWENGVKPSGMRPSKDMPAIWRGVEAQGSDAGPLDVEGVGRLPNDETGRPTSIEGVQSPFKVSHTLLFEAWHSVYGEDVEGRPLPDGGHGQVRVLRVEKSVVVPSCVFIPDMLELPSYGDLQCDNAPCPVCKAPPELQACSTCPLTSVPHPRHDHDPAVVGNPSGVCPRCEKKYLTDDITGKWRDCACGLSLGQMEERMRKVILPGDRTPTGPHDTEVRIKEESSERGRSRQ